MRALVIGAGFISQHLVKKLIELDYEVIIYQRNETSLAHVETIHGDIRNSSLIRKTLLKVQPNIIFHLAAYKERTREPQYFHQAFEANLLATQTILTICCELQSLQALIVMGTAEEYGDTNSPPFVETLREQPNSVYSLSKVCQTYLCQTYHRLYKLPVVVLRPSIVYGPEQGQDMFLPALILSLLRNKNFSMTKGEQTRDFIFVDDLINVMLLATKNLQARGEVINIASGKAIRLEFLAKYVAKLLMKEEFLQVDALPYRKNEIFNYSVDISKACELLNWIPKTSFESGLEKTINYYKNLLLGFKL